MFKNFIYIAVIIIFAFLAGFSLLKSGLPPTHDGEYHVVRFYQFDKILREGDWYPRWAPDLNYGFGVPLFNYVYPLPNYAASFFHFLGFSFIDAFKLQMFSAVIIGAIFFYLWAKIFWGKLGGIVSSVFYTYAPYHFVDIYVRGSVGEVWALALFPAFLWTTTIFIKEKNKKFGALSSVFLALTIFSHNILGLMFFIFSGFYILFLIYQSKEKRYVILYTLYFILFGLGLSAIFWLPALLEQGYVKGLKIYNIEDNFPEIYQLIFPSWGTGFSNSDLENQMSFQIGIANLFGVVLSLIALFFIKNSGLLAANIKNQKSKIKYNLKDQKYLILFFLISFFIIFFLTLKVSLPVWQTVPFMNFFQFPWRLLSLEILITSFLAGSIFSLWQKRSIKVYILAVIMVVISVGLSISYAKPAYYHDRTDNYYITRENFIYGTNSIGDYFNTIWAKKANKLQDRKIQKNDDIKVLSEFVKTTNYKFNVVANKDTEITINTAYFPGWVVFVDEKETEIKSDRYGLISFPIVSGNHIINVQFKDTIVRTAAVIISLLSFSFVFFYYFLR